MNIGIVGCGFVAKFNVDAWRRLGAKVTALCDINPESLNKAKKMFGVENGYLSYKDMLRHESLDAISVCTIPSTHAEIAVAALDAGCLVAVEKPFAVNSKEAEVFRHNKKIMVFHNQIYEDKYYTLTSYFRKNKVQVKHVDVSLMATVNESMTANLKHWAYNMNGGRIAECMPHPIYTAQFFLGNNVTVENVFATRFSDRPTYNELTAFIKSPLGTAMLHVKLDAAKDTNSIMAYSDKAVFMAGLNPSFIGAYHYPNMGIPKLKKNKSFNRKLLAVKKYVSPALHYGGSFIPKLKGGYFFSSRYLMLKELLAGNPFADGEHAFNNIRIEEEIISRLEK